MPAAWSDATLKADSSFPQWKPFQPADFFGGLFS
jgi:hypothetical protein